MFNSIYSEKLTQYYNLRCSVLSESAKKHELCYLRRFDHFLNENISGSGQLTEGLMSKWISTLSGKSGSVENMVIVIRQFLDYLASFGEDVYYPAVPKVRDDYIPYIFSDEELASIFESADNVIQNNSKADPYLEIEFPVILRLLYSCGLRIGEAVKIKTLDVDFEKGVLRLVNTKGNKHRLVPMSAIMSDILTRYYVAMGLAGSSNEWLFPSSKHDGHISGESVKRRFAVILKNNGIQLHERKKHERGPCLHCMRHVFAFKSFTQAERSGRHLDDAIPYLSIYLGHDSLSETSKYLKFSNELFPDSIDAFGEFISELLPEVDYGT